MKNNQKGFAPILIILLVVVLVGGGAYLYTQNSSKDIVVPEVKEESKNDKPSTVLVPSNDESVEQNASGIIKSVYTKNNKNYIDIDYIEYNPNWKPGGMSGPAYTNTNTKIRTFEISSDTKFIVGSPAEESITLQDFEKFFIDSTFYQKYNPWDIIIVGDVVKQITEHYLP